MIFSERLAGILVALLGMAASAMAWNFPAMPGQRIGPTLFPLLIGLGLVGTGARLLLSRPIGQAAHVEWHDDLKRPRMLVNLAAVVFGLVLYAVVVGALGFFVTSTLFLALLFTAFGVPVRWMAVLAVIVPIVLHYMFYTGLRVPLPWGVLEGMAW